MSRFTMVAVLAAAVGATALPALAQQATTVKVGKSDRYGTYLTDSEGRALYMFTPDKDHKSTCYDACAKAWPPVLVKGELKPGDPAVRANLLGKVARSDGTTQVTYNGWPVYEFVRDKKPGETNGEGVSGFGGEWYLVAPDGKRVEGTH